jgi:hypothetical protein
MYAMHPDVVMLPILGIKATFPPTVHVAVTIGAVENLPTGNVMLTLAVGPLINAEPDADFLTAAPPTVTVLAVISPSPVILRSPLSDSIVAGAAAGNVVAAGGLVPLYTG